MNTILCVLFERFDDADFARKRDIGKDLIMFRLDLNSIPCPEFNSLDDNSFYPARIQAHFTMDGRLSLRQKSASKSKIGIFSALMRNALQHIKQQNETRQA